MISFDVNYLAVLVSAIIAFGVGFAYYHDILFGRKWRELSWATPAMEGMAQSVIIGFIGTLVTAFVLASVVRMFNAATFIEGVVAGFWVWLGFVATVTLGTVAWEKKPWGLWFINNGHNLLTIALMAGILAVWV